MNWENQIKKRDATAEINRALNIVRKLIKHYNIKPEHIEGLVEILIGFQE